MRLIATAISFVLLFAAASAARGAGCSQESDYARAVCLYRAGSFAEAEPLFAASAAAVASPETIKAEYFLARCRMKLGRFSDAAQGLMKIYSLDPSFYREWSCDFLLGECRKAMGLG